MTLCRCRPGGLSTVTEVVAMATVLVVMVGMIVVCVVVMIQMS